MITLNSHCYSYIFKNQLLRVYTIPGTVPGSKGINDKREIKDTILTLIGEADVNQISSSAVV